MNSKILREIIIILLLVIVILFAFGVLFYDCISVDKDSIYSVQYVIDDKTNEVLKEIQKNSGIDIENENSTSILKSYSIGEEELYMYESQNSYESGKKDPFAESSESVKEVVTETEKNATVPNSQTNNYVNTNEISNKTSSNKSKENGKKETNENSTTGTFFENKNSK